MAIIGTGASAAQFIPAVAEAAAHLTVFQRTPPWLLETPNYHDDCPHGMRWLLDHVPGVRQLGPRLDLLAVARGDSCRWPRSTRAGTSTESVSMLNDLVRQLFTEYYQAAVPEHPSCSTRCCRTTRRSRSGSCATTGSGPARSPATTSTLDVGAIDAITETGVRTADGVEHEVDVIIYGTGFQASKLPDADDGPRVAAASTCTSTWDGEARAYLGLTIPDFPNLFLMYGPNTNIVINGSIIYFSELEARYIAECVRMLLYEGRTSLEVQARRARRVQRAGRRGEPPDGLGRGVGEHLVQERVGSDHAELAVLAARVLAVDPHARPRRLRPALVYARHRAIDTPSSRSYDRDMTDDRWHAATDVAAVTGAPVTDGPTAARRHPQGCCGCWRPTRPARRGRSPGPMFLGHIVQHAVLDPRDGRTLLVGARTGHLGPTVFRSTDLGATWTEATRPPAFTAGEPLGRSLRDGVLAHARATRASRASGTRAARRRACSAPRTAATRGSRSTGWNDHPMWETWAEWPEENTPDGSMLHSVIVDPRDPATSTSGCRAAACSRAPTAAATGRRSTTGSRPTSCPSPTPEFGHDPHCVRLHPLRPDRLYQQNHCGIYRMDRPDGRWVRIGDNMPRDVGDIGFPIELHPRDPDTAWVFPMDGTDVWPRTSPDGRPAVYVTRDAGASWTRCDDGPARARRGSP